MAYVRALSTLPRTDAALLCGALATAAASLANAADFIIRYW